MATNSWARAGYDPEDMADLARRFPIGTRVKYIGTRGRHQGQTGTVISYHDANGLKLLFADQSVGLSTPDNVKIVT
jgi:hypothetical protein